MLLRSTSTPAIRSLLSESPNRNFHTTKTNNNCFKHHTSAVHGGCHRRSSSSFSCNSSPISPSASGSSEFSWKTNSLTHKPFRRARSDGNLVGLATSFDSDKFWNSNSKVMLHSAPSFCIYTSEDGFDGDNEKERLESEKLERPVAIGERNEEMGSGEFSFANKGMGLIEETDEEEEVLSESQDLGTKEEVGPASPRMYLATGLGVDSDGIGGGGGGGFSPECFGGGGNVEEYYKRMVGEDPSNPLFLRNYAQLLVSNGDLHGAEEYLFRATLADPTDGEICSSYAKLVWELHRDQDRALNYFQQATQASPEDSHVLAAYACFLWETEEAGEDDYALNDHTQIEGDRGLFEVKEKEPISPGGVGGIENTYHIAADSDEGGNIEDYYKRMVEGNPCNPLFLRNYAQFLYQSKGDLRGAEEYYSRAILADPVDGEILSQYASLVWELHHDHDKTLCYFERAVQASPQDSHVLAAYAKFLWETQDDEEEEEKEKSSTWQNHIQTPLSVGAMTSANA